MPIAVRETGNTILIILEGDINVACAGEMKSILVSSLASTKEISLSLEGATELDVTGMQLVFAAEQYCATSNRQLKLVGSIPTEVTVAMADAGFPKFHSQQ